MAAIHTFFHLKTYTKATKSHHIEVSNYFNPQNQIDSGTSNQDKTHHGYGLKSMEYVVHKHGGKLLVEKEDNIFILSLVIPVISNEKSK